MGTEATIRIKCDISHLDLFRSCTPQPNWHQGHVDVHGRYATARDPDLVIHAKDLAAALEVYRGMGELWQIDPKREWVSVP